MSKRAALPLAIAIALFPPCAFSDPALKLIEAARSQIGTTIRYDSSYRTLTYPNGDIPSDRGVCTDVVIRSLRKSKGIDLQQLVHEDMSAHFSLYPKNWGLKQPDRNIDHRRVPNLQMFFERKRWLLPVSRQAEDYKPGDIVTSLIPPNLPHIMIVSDKKTPFGRPLVIHNIGAGTQEEDRLFEYPITGHYRITTVK